MKKNQTKIASTKMLYIIVSILFVSATVNCQPGFGQVWVKNQASLFQTIGLPGSWNSIPTSSAFAFGHGMQDGDNFILYPSGDNGSRLSIGHVSTTVLESGWTFFENNPIFIPSGADDWEYNAVGNSMVMKDENNYKMWYTGYSSNTDISAIGYATSADGLTWTRYSNSPVLTADTSTSAGESVYAPYVIKENNIYKMWYTSSPSQSIYEICYATSTDGINWTKSENNPVLERGVSGSWDDHSIQCPVVLVENNKYLMWYMGADAAVPGAGFLQTGFAISDDGINWTKDEVNNPVLKVGSGSDQDSKVAACVQVFNDNGTYKMLYGASNLTTYMGVKMAVLRSSTTDVTDSDELPIEFCLSQNYPNPFNPTTNISYTMPEAGMVTLKVYDMLGKELQTLVNENKSAGTHNVVFNASNLTSGIYFYRISTNDYTASGKMTLMK